MLQMERSCSVFYLSLLLIHSYGHEGTNLSLKQIHVFFRHGERTPTGTYKNDPYSSYNWQGGWGQLTNFGKLQMYTLGQTLGDVYKEFVPSDFLLSKIRVLSSYADRCETSAQVLLAGMFPPRGDNIWNQDLMWQPIPITVLPRAHDTLIVMKVPCAKYDQQFQEVLKSKELRQIDKDYSDLYKYLTDSTGDVINSISAVELLYNTLEIEQLHNLTLPEWTISVYPHEMKFLASKTLAIYSHNDYMKRVKGGVFIKHVMTAMRNIVNGKEDSIVHLYAGHDISIVNILRAFSVKDIFKPGFGASFVIELHQIASAYYVKMFYRDDFKSNPEGMNVGGCPEMCPLDDFNQNLLPMIPVDLIKECEL